MRNAFGTPGTGLVLGGNSDLARAILRRLEQTGLEKVLLAVRDPQVVSQSLDREAWFSGQAFVERWDALDDATTTSVLERARRVLGDIDLVLMTVGSLGRAEAEDVAARSSALIDSNFRGPAVALLRVSQTLRAQHHGTVVVFSSVAGARVRKDNYLYGAAKAGLDALAQGLRDDLVEDNVMVHIVRPGFVATKMTAGMEPAPFATDPDSVARAVEKAIRGRRPRILWVPPILGPLFFVFRNLPTRVWQRISSAAR